MTYDLVVVGGGPVGLALALGARGCAVALVSRTGGPGTGAPSGPSFEDGFDARVYAISPGNVAFLRACGAWEALPAERVTPVYQMQIFGDEGESRLAFDAYRAGVPALAWTVEDSLLQRTLWRRAEAAGDATLLAPTEPTALALTERHVCVQLSDGVALEAGLVVGADGARSFVRQAAGIPVHRHGYGQTAVVANFACERAHGNTAFQWFQGGPVLALLPLPGDRVSMIWSLPEDAAASLLSLDEEGLCREVERASHARLGQLRLLGAPVSYALRGLSARRITAPRVALVGDAARVIHPLAGQGLNLGLQDARVLAEVLASRAPSQSAGDPPLLRRYARRRAEPALAMETTVNTLYHLFRAPGAGPRRLRNAGLNLVGRLPVITNLLARRAME